MGKDDYDFLTDKIFEQIEKDIEEVGVATVTVKDGRVMVFQLAKLKEIVKNVEDAGKDVVCIFIQDPRSLN